MRKKVLIIGGGVAGASCGYFLTKKGHEVTILEKNNYVGGLSRTFYYNGHPYEFGPHVWFWPHDDINDVIRELTNNELYNVDRKLYTFTGENLYRYPIHYSDILNMPDKEQIFKEWSEVRDENHKLIYDRLPQLGECKFEDYFKKAIGPTLYNRFMKDYTHKMWGISGADLETNMVWADRIKDTYSNKIEAYDPIKFKDEFLGAGQPNWYPKKGWNVVWDGMVKGCKVIYNTEILKLDSFGTLLTTKGDFKTSDYDTVICCIHVDSLLGQCVLPANGRLVIPYLIPKLEWAYPDGAESIHYSDTTALTRTTEMKIITRYNSPDTLITLEIPVDMNQINMAAGSKAVAPFPSNVVTASHFHPRCYNWQTEEAISLHNYLVGIAENIVPNLLFTGRHGSFKYFGMPEVVHNANKLIKENF